MVRKLGIFIVAFALVAAGGIAFAQMGEYLPSADDETAAASDVEAPVDETTPPTTEPEAEIPEEPAEKAVPPSTTVAEVAAEKDAPSEEEPATVKEEADTTPPQLVITYPENGAVFDAKELEFKGEVEPGATVKAAGYHATVTDDGHWSIVLMLEPGGNLATIKAFDAAGNVAEATVKVFYEPPAGDYTFTANQKYKVSASNPPYDVFYGTGRPGSTVTASSPYGSASTTVGEKGKWEMKVTFPDAPYYEWFAVTVQDSDGHSKAFEFKSKYNPDATYDFTITQKYVVNAYQWEKFHGTATPGTVIGAYSEYGSAETVADGSGQFYLKVHFEGLTAGQTIGIVVETSEGDRRTFEFRYEPAPIEFTANQAYGSCSETPPYEKFYGTATPGATVWAESAYGGASTVASAEGKWDLKVFFEGATPGEPFTITVGDSEGHSKSFTFTVLPAGG